MITIKRYRNRRLYHTGDKAFIVLADLERMVKHGERFRVIDQATGNDITVSMLTAVLSERVHGWKDLADTQEILRAVITVGGEKSMGILKDTVLAGIGFVELTRKKAEELVDSLIKSGELSKSEKKEAMLELLSKAETKTKETTGKITKEVDKAIKNFTITKKSEIEALSKKIDRLGRKLSSLEKKVDNLEPKGSADEE
jgi:polyhydroxyalkanoate synthesis repressor PhaR